MIKNGRERLNLNNDRSRLQSAHGLGRCLVAIKSNRWLGVVVVAAVIVSVTASIIVLSRFRSQAAADTGTASFNGLTVDTSSVSSAGQKERVTSVKIGDTTLTEGVDSATGYRQILDNNSVIYQVKYNATTPGQITLVMTLPVNNTIDASSVSAAAGCVEGESQVQKADVDGQVSYTNNQAVCVVNKASQGSSDWSVRANLWGGNGAKITPQLSIGGINQTIAESPNTTVILLGKPNYKLNVYKSGNIPPVSGDWNKSVRMEMSLYIPNNGTDNLGVEPLKDNRFDFIMDTSKLPKGWEVDMVMRDAGFHVNCLGERCVAGDVKVQATKIDDNQLKVSILDTPTAVDHWPTVNKSGNAINDNNRYYANLGVYLAVPVAGLSEGNSEYSISLKDVPVEGMSGQPGSVGTVKSLTWTLSNQGRVDPGGGLFADSNNPADLTAPKGWNTYYDGSGALYYGEKVRFRTHITGGSIPGSDHVDDFYQCTTWNPSLGEINRDIQLPTNKDDFGDTMPVWEYGVVGTDMTKIPSSAQSSCGHYGDKSTDTVKFFAKLSDAEAYAKSNNLKVNAVRFYSKQMRLVSRDTMVFAIPITVVGRNAGGSAVFSESMSAKQWPEKVLSIGSGVSFVDGIVFHSISVQPASSNPNTKSHITLIPASYGQDSGVSIAVTLPSGLTPQAGSFVIGDKKLTAGSDYSVTKNADGTTTATIYLGTVGQLAAIDSTTGLPALPAHSVSQTPVEFDVIVGGSIPVPSTLTLNSIITGQGTARTKEAFRTASTDMAVAEKREFNYNLLSSASSISVGEDLSYDYSSSNSTDNNISDFDEIAVLPYNGDSRGTTGLLDNPYRISEYSVTDDENGGNVQLFYTTDTKVRELEKDNPKALATDQSIKWVVYNPNQDKLPDQTTAPITALRWKQATLAKDSNSTVKVTLSDINAANPTEQAPTVLGNDISYIAAKTTATDTTSSTHLLQTTTKYLGESVGLSLDNNNVEVRLKPVSVTPDLSQILRYSANTKKGYSLVVSDSDNDTSLTTADGRTIPSFATKPIAGTANWAMKLQGSGGWLAIPSQQKPVLLQSSTTGGKVEGNYTLTFAVSTAITMPGTYTDSITYSITPAI